MKHTEIRDARDKVLFENKQVLDLKATLSFFRIRIKEIEDVLYHVKRNIILSEEYSKATEEDCEQMKAQDNYNEKRS